MSDAWRRTVVVLGVASLLTDLSSDMIYPLLPAYLAVTLGAGAIGLGAMEGAAEATSSLLKIASGKLADRVSRRKPLVVMGYGLSGLMRPLIGFAVAWPVVIFLRVVDRVGKGIRTSPRDALIADVTPSEARGRAYGLHRAMDNAGAVLGPALAALLITLGVETRAVFWWAAVPAVLVIVVLIFGIRETPREPSVTAMTTERAPLRELGPSYRRFLLVVVVFTLGNSSDMFLLLRLGEAGLGPTGVTLAWGAHNLVRTFATYFGGKLADRFDRRRLLTIGWALYALAYTAMAFFDSPVSIVVLIVAYALHYGAVEPTERAIVADLAPASLRGSAFGWFHGSIGLAALPASALFGVLYASVAPKAAFGVGAALALAAVIGLVTLVPFGRSPARSA